jgi:hypothetical protein
MHAALHSCTYGVLCCVVLQGRDEPFLEQWHQKLHQNTTPEDVTICEAYLAFLHSGKHLQPDGCTGLSIAMLCVLS